MVTYDIKVEDSNGRRIYRRLRKICRGLGEPLQKSVYIFVGDVHEALRLKREILMLLRPQDRICIARVNGGDDDVLQRLITKLTDGEVI